MAERLGDPADKEGIEKEAADQFRKVASGRRAGGWSVEQWIDWYRRHPYADAPGGVPAMIIGYFDKHIEDLKNNG